MQIFGQAGDFSAGIQGAAADHNHGAAGLGQNGDGPLNGVMIDFCGQDFRLDVGFGRGLRQHVPTGLNRNRTAAATVHLRKRFGHYLRRLIGLGNMPRPLQHPLKSGQLVFQFMQVAAT